MMMMMMMMMMVMMMMMKQSFIKITAEVTKTSAKCLTWIASSMVQFEGPGEPA